MVSMKDLKEIYDKKSQTKLVWYLYLDIYVLNDDGNVRDACVLAMVAALKSSIDIISLN